MVGELLRLAPSSGAMRASANPSLATAALQAEAGEFGQQFSGEERHLSLNLLINLVADLGGLIEHHHDDISVESCSFLSFVM